MKFKINRSLLTIPTIAICAAFLNGCGPSDVSANDYSQVTARLENQPVKRCINMGSALEAPPGENWGYTIRADDFARIRAAGFDTVRLPVKWSAYTGPGPDYTIDPRFLNYVDGVLESAIHRDVKVIINVHHFNEFNENPAAQEAKLLRIWTQLSEYFRGWPDHLMFEFINEPHFDAVNGGVDEDYKTPKGIARMNRLNAQFMQIIRKDHPSRWVVLGSSQWGSHYPLVHGVNGVKFAPNFDPRVITTFHYYEPLEFTHQDMEFTDYPPYPRKWGTRQDVRAVEKVFDDVAKYRSDNGRNMPVLLGEFGAGTSISTDQRLLYLGVVKRASEKKGMGWCVFDFAGPTFGMFDANTNRWDTGLVNTLMDRR